MLNDLHGLADEDSGGGRLAMILHQHAPHAHCLLTVIAHPETSVQFFFFFFFLQGSVLIGEENE